MIFSSTKSVDRGWAWVICGASFTFLFCFGGTLNSFGVLFVGLVDEYATASPSNPTNYSTLSSSTSVSDGNSGLIAWIVTIALNVLCAFAPVVTSLQGRFGPQLVLVAGTIAMVSGLLLTSLTDSIWQVFLTYSILIGVGSSILHTTPYSLLPHYFRTRLFIACSLSSTGRFLGAACLSPVARIVMKIYGWRRMLQLTALLGVPMLICSALFRPSATIPCQKMGLLERLVKCCKLLKNVRLTFYSSLIAVNCTAIYIPLIYIIQYAEETLQIDEDQSGFLLTAMFVAAAVSSVLAGMIALRVKRNMFFLQLFIALGGLSSLLFPVYHSYFHLMVYMTIQGVAFSQTALIPVVPVTSEIIGIRDAADAFGMVTFTQAVGLLGVPLAGWMYDKLGSYTPGFLLSGSISLSVSLLLFLDSLLKKKCVWNGSVDPDVDCNTSTKASDREDGDVPTVVYYETYV